MECVRHAKKAVIIGGGVLGLEAAFELWRRGLKITVLEATGQFIGRSVHASTAQTVMQRMERMGVTCVTSAAIDGMTGDEEGAVSGVLLKDGTVYPAQLVIISRSRI